MNENKYSLKDIFDKDIQTIEIPKIQRDFAYGRIDAKTTDKRINFVNRIFDCLENGKELELDFIYGYKDNQSLIPLDGQQRLTILFLLYWILLPEGEEKLLDITKKKALLTYNTRFSSADFCFALVNNRYADLASNFINIKKPDFLIHGEGKEKSDLNIDYKDLLNDKITYESLFPNSNNGTYEEKNTYNRQKKMFNQYVCELKKANTISSKIKDMNWFLWSWKDNPTIKSMLVMLDCFEEKIKEKTKEEINNLYKNLNNIYFYFLNLDEYNMSEKLYVKMNARGKQLSDFDYYKSLLDRKLYSIDDGKNADEWRRSFDNVWMNYFWNLCIKKGSDPTDKDVLEVERVYIDFINKILLLYLMNDEIYEPTTLNSWEEAIKIYGGFVLPDDYAAQSDTISKTKVLVDTVKSYLRKLYQDEKVKTSKDISFVANLGLLDRPLKDGTLNFFDYFIKSINSLFYFDELNNQYRFVAELASEVSFPDNFISNILINESKKREVYIFIKGILLFTLKHGASEIKNNKTYLSNFNEWCRFIKNLSLFGNTFCDNGEDFYKIINIIDGWKKSDIDFTENADSAISNFKADGPSYFKMQLTEEVEKAILKLTDKDEECSKDNEDIKWFDLINTAEKHPYFQGQINFMFDYSKTERVGEYNKKKFNDITIKTQKIFNETGVADRDMEEGNPYPYMNSVLLKRAMLCIDDFRLKDSCFIYSYESKDRDRSWRAFFRNDEKRGIYFNVIKDWDLQISLQDYLNNFIVKHSTNDIEDWKKCFINRPEIFQLMVHGVMVQRIKESEDKSMANNSNIGNLLLIKSPRIFNWNSVFQDLWLAYWAYEYNGTLINSNEMKAENACSLKLDKLEIKAIFNEATKIEKYSIFKDGQLFKDFLPNEYSDVEDYIKKNIE